MTEQSLRSRLRLHPVLPGKYKDWVEVERNDPRTREGFIEVTSVLSMPPETLSGNVFHVKTDLETRRFVAPSPFPETDKGQVLRYRDHGGRSCVAVPRGGDRWDVFTSRRDEEASSRDEMDTDELRNDIGEGEEFEVL